LKRLRTFVIDRLNRKINDVLVGRAFVAVTRYELLSQKYSLTYWQVEDFRADCGPVAECRLHARDVAGAAAAAADSI